MKNVFTMIVLLSFCVFSFAAELYTGVNDDVQDISCMPGSAVCDITMVNGQSLSEPQENLTRYLSVGNANEAADEDALFLYESHGDIIGLNPKTFSNSQTQQPVVQLAAEPPYKLSVENGNNTTSIKVVNLTSSLVVENVIFNEGNCRLVSVYNNSPKILKMGEGATFSTFIHCNIVKIDVITNQGSWSHTIQ